MKVDSSSLTMFAPLECRDAKNLTHTARLRRPYSKGTRSYELSRGDITKRRDRVQCSKHFSMNAGEMDGFPFHVPMRTNSGTRAFSNAFNAGDVCEVSVPHAAHC